MGIYVIMFLGVCLLTKVAQELFKVNKKGLGIIVSIIIIIVPSIIAGVRDTTIGTDVENYVGPDFHYAKISDSIIEYCQESKEEVGYSVLNFIVSRFTDDVHWLMFIIQLIMTTLIYITIYKHREKIPMWMGMAVFFAFIYPRFLNIIRQGIAISIIIFAINYVESKNIKKFAIAVLIATLFHRTAIMAIPLYFLYMILEKNTEKSRKVIIITYIVLILSIFVYDYALQFILQLNIMPDKFESYLTKYRKDEIDFSVFATVYKAIWIVWGILAYKKLKEYNKDTKLYVNLLAIDLIFWQFNAKIENAERLSYYYGCIGNLLLIPMLPKMFKQDKITQILVKAGIVGLLIFYFWWCFVHYSAGEIYPYTSEILGIY